MSRENPNGPPFKLMSGPCSCSCGCGELVKPSKRSPSGNRYANLKHQGQHKTAMYMEDYCGPYLDIVRQYLAQAQYKNTSTVRSALCPFLLFLAEAGGPDLAAVRPALISSYLEWAEEQDYCNARHNISVIKVFFDWCAAMGWRTGSNPVVTRFHGERRAHHLPRPYSATEMDAIWCYALERGDAQIRAVLALGEATGLRIGELCNLRLGDVYLQRQSVFVRLPNKGDTERFAPFTDKATAYLGEWLAAREATAEHDHLFVNTSGRPFLPGTLHRTLARVFCKNWAGKALHEEGLDTWSTHRLRHTMASDLRSGGAAIQTILSVGGWKSIPVMLGYAKADMDRLRLDYEDSMKRASERETHALAAAVLTDEEFLAICDEGNFNI